jgi:hypothetical protein
MPRVQVILSDALDERFTAYCEAKGYKKSTLVARLIKDHLDREGYAAQSSLPLAPPSRRRKTDTHVQEG